MPQMNAEGASLKEPEGRGALRQLELLQRLASFILICLQSASNPGPVLVILHYYVFPELQITVTQKEDASLNFQL